MDTRTKIKGGVLRRRVMGAKDGYAWSRIALELIRRKTPRGTLAALWRAHLTCVLMFAVNPHASRHVSKVMWTLITYFEERDRDLLVAGLLCMSPRVLWRDRFPAAHALWQQAQSKDVEDHAVERWNHSLIDADRRARVFVAAYHFVLLCREDPREDLIRDTYTYTVSALEKAGDVPEAVALLNRWRDLNHDQVAAVLGQSAE